MLAPFIMIVFATSAASAQQFTAQLNRHTSDGQTTTGRISVSNDRVRIETPELPTSFFIVRLDKSAVYLVRPQQHEFMDARQSSPLTDILVPMDPDAPCRQLQAMANISQRMEGEGSWQCEPIRNNATDDRKTLQYRLTSRPDWQYVAWIDPQLRFVTRLTAADGTTFTLDNIREETPPSDSFEIPAGLRKFEPAQLIERIKRSDVWVVPTQ